MRDYSDYNVYDEDYYEQPEGVLVVYGDCSCYENYICRNCLSKW